MSSNPQLNSRSRPRAVMHAFAATALLVAVTPLTGLSAPGYVSHVVTNDIPSRPLVQVSVTSAIDSASFAYEETLPGTVAATNVTGGGTWIPELGKIRWGAFTNTQSTNRITWEI